MRRAVITLALVGLAAGCSSDTTAAPDDTATTSEPFAGGEFQLEVERVDDGCLEGALDLVFMPTGTATPYPLKNTTYLPSEAQLPHEYVMALEAPFDDMTMTMTAAPDGGLQVRAAEQQNVLLAIAGSGSDCTANMSFDADVTVVTADAVTMAVRVTLTDMQSPTDSCPAVVPPCEVALTLRGARAAP